MNWVPLSKFPIFLADCKSWEDNWPRNNSSQVSHWDTTTELKAARSELILILSVQKWSLGQPSVPRSMFCIWCDEISGGSHRNTKYISQRDHILNKDETHSRCFCCGMDTEDKEPGLLFLKAGRWVKRGWARSVVLDLGECLSELIVCA